MKMCFLHGLHPGKLLRLHMPSPQAGGSPLLLRTVRRKSMDATAAVHAKMRGRFNDDVEARLKEKEDEKRLFGHNEERVSNSSCDPDFLVAGEQDLWITVELQ